jgi:hypothetical protein
MSTMMRTARLGLAVLLLATVAGGTALAASGSLKVKVQVASPTAFDHPADLFRMNSADQPVSYFVRVSGWSGGKTLDPRRVTVLIKTAKGEGTIYQGSLANLPAAGPLFVGTRLPGGSVTLDVFATVPTMAALHGAQRSVTLSISLGPR